MKVQILYRKIVKPSAPTPSHLRTYKLSFFDQLAPKMHIPFIYFYPFNGSGTANKIKSAERTEQLEKSLSEILTRFYPLAGRYAADGLTVDCDDQGVEYLEAQVDCELDQFLCETYKDIDLVNDLVPWDIGEYMAVTTPMLGVQVSVFECGGLALTVHFSHGIIDGFMGSTIVDEWAKLSRLGMSEVMIPSFDGASIFPPRDVPKVLKPFPIIKNGAKVITKIFVFDRVAISTLKDKVRASAASAGFEPPSRLKVVMALTMKVILRISRAKHGHLKTSTTSLSVNLREKTAVTTTKKTFGNVYSLISIKFTADESKMELHDLFAQIADPVEKAIGGCREASSTADDIFEMFVNFQEEIREEIRNDRVDVGCFTSLCRFPLYEADFGWGKPSWVSGTGCPEVMVSLVDTKCGTGIEARASLEEMDMLEFECDPDIMSFTSLLK